MFIVVASLDNAAVAVLPSLYGVAAVDLAVPEGALGLVTALTILVTAVTGVVWGYLGDRHNRKLLLVAGTLTWAAGIGGAGFAGSYAGMLVGHVVAAVGLGAIASIGFSVVADLVTPRRRGLAMSFWGLSQGLGTGLGMIGGGVLGATDWQRPFRWLALLAVVAGLAYLFAEETPRGAREQTLQSMFARGEGYGYTIRRADLPELARRRTNLWLVAQGFTAQFAYGSLVWLPRLFQAKVEAAGYPLETATMVGSLFAAVFQLGGVFSILGGWVGDQWARRDQRGRALVSAIGILGGIPFYLALFAMPLSLELPAHPTPTQAVTATLASIVSEPTVAVTFLVALVALALTSANSPNWFALIADVNLPEHRGTVYGLGNLSNGLGRSAGNALVGYTFGWLTAAFPPPLNYVLGLSAFQAFFLPTGWCYLQAARTSPGDMATVGAVLAARAAGSGTAGPAAGSGGSPPGSPTSSPPGSPTSSPPSVGEQTGHPAGGDLQEPGQV